MSDYQLAAHNFEQKESLCFPIASKEKKDHRKITFPNKIENKQAESLRPAKGY
jgi:hypothetical protein